jgi:nicotinamide-nucleotide amidase
MNLNELAERLIQRGESLATVESCTGGGIATECTEIPGSSQWFEGGLVTYSNLLKIKLGVDPALLEREGAVSEAVVQSMAEQGRVFCDASWTISVSGVAGPDGGSIEKPVGTVWMAWANKNITHSEKKIFSGNRHEIRRQTVIYTLEKLIDLLDK